MRIWALALVASASWGHAAAQEAGTNATVEEVLVTAQRRSEAVQDVPVAVSVISGAELAKQDINTLEDLSAKIPGFVSTQATGYGQAPLTIRGVGGANGGGNTFADEPVAVYQDGVFQTGLGGVSSGLFDLKSLQILRGPQGTLFGRNATAGAVLVETADPTWQTEGELGQEADSLGTIRTTAMVSTPIIADKLALRLAGAWSDRGGYAENRLNGKGIGGSDQLGLRGVILAEPTEASQFRLSVDYLDATYRPTTVHMADLSNLAQVNPFKVRPDLQDAISADKFSYDSPNEAFEKRWTVALRSSWDLGFAQLTSTTGYRHRRAHGGQESDGTGQLLSFNRLNVARNEDFSQEFVLTGDTGRLRWTVGAFGYDSDFDLNIDVGNGRATFALGQLAHFDSHQKTKAYAGFFDVGFEVTDALTLTVGGRYSSERKTFAADPLILTLRSGVEAQAFGFVPPTLVGRPAGSVLADPPALAGRNTFHDFSPRAVLDWKLTDDVLAYASYSQGFKSGGFNAFATAPADVAFKPEQIEAIEVGLKSDLLDRRLRLNLSGYHYDYTDLQVRIGVPTGGVNIKNAASAEVWGVDGELTWRPDDTLTVNATATYLDAEFSDGILPAIPDTTFAFGSAIPLVNVDVSGNRLSRAPRFMGAIAVEKVWRTGGFDVTGRLAARHQGRIFFVETNQVAATYQQKGWEQVDASLRLGPAGGGRWDVTVFATNLFDKRVITQVGSYSGFPQGVPNEPRAFGVRGSFRFE